MEQCHFIFLQGKILSDSFFPVTGFVTRQIFVLGISAIPIMVYKVLLRNELQGGGESIPMKFYLLWNEPYYLQSRFKTAVSFYCSIEH